MRRIGAIEFRDDDRAGMRDVLLNRQVRNPCPRRQNKCRSMRDLRRRAPTAVIRPPSWDVTRAGVDLAKGARCTRTPKVW